MSENLASALIVIIGVVGIGALITMQVQSRRVDLPPRTRTIWNLAGWSTLTLVGIMIWTLAAQMAK